MNLLKTPANFTDQFREWKRWIFVSDITLIIAVFSLFGIFRPDYVIIFAYFLLFPYLFITQRKKLIYHLLVASVMAFLWVYFARDIYGYNTDFITIMGIDLYPLFAWAVGLFATYAIYRQHRYFSEKWGFGKHLFLFSIFFWAFLLFVETVAYHVFNVRITTAIYEGLPICDCLHAPTWMKAVYFSMGPLFFTISYFLGIERPHIKR